MQGLRLPVGPVARRPARLLCVELAALVALAVVGISPLPLLLRTRLPLSGAFGVYAEDQLQFFAWIRDASGHVFAGDRFDLAPGMRSLLHPGFTISGLVHAATGLSVPFSYLLWEPVALALVFVGCRRYVRRLIPAGGARDAALVLALFAVSPLYLVVRSTGWVQPDVAGMTADLSREVWLAGYLWGYQVTAAAIGLMPLVLIALESWRNTGSPGIPWKAVIGAVLISWIHPWQGATLVISIGVAEAVELMRTRQPPRMGWVAVLVAFAAPAVYYLLLTRFDPIWSIYQDQNARVDRPWLPPLLAVLPLAIPALFAYGHAKRDWQEVVVRAWPIAALVVYIMPLGAYPFHAFDGIVLPLAILAVDGVVHAWPQARRTAVVVAIAVLAIPGWVDGLRTISTKAASGEHGYFIKTDEAHAFAALERDRRPGGVLTTVSTGALVPFATGRKVYVGHDSWSPNFAKRARQTEDLFRGRLVPDDARAFVRATHARFLVADCRHEMDLRGTLAPLLAQVTRFGCATLYELVEQPDMAAAAGPPDS
jgi:hypothetical protein